MSIGATPTPRTRSNVMATISGCEAASTVAGCAVHLLLRAASLHGLPSQGPPSCNRCQCNYSVAYEVSSRLAPFRQDQHSSCHLGRRSWRTRSALLRPPDYPTSNGGTITTRIEVRQTSPQYPLPTRNCCRSRCVRSRPATRLAKSMSWRGSSNHSDMALS